MKARLYRSRNIAIAAGAIGLILSAVGWTFDPGQFYRSYLVSYLLWLGIALGCISLLMIFHMTGGNWGYLTRRLFESGSRTVPLMLLLILPVLIGIPHLYIWSHADAVAKSHVLQHKAPYLNTTAFLIRACIYFAFWLFLMLLLNRGNQPISHRLQRISGPGLVLHGFIVTFAVVDWVMSLEPEWFSTMFGLIFLVGQLLSALAFGIIILMWIADEGAIAEIARPTRLLDLGNLMLTFVMLWAYTSFSQFLIIWSGNLPDENPWYLHRLGGGWQWIALVLVLFHFAVPFLLLLSRYVKRRSQLLAGIALGMLFMRFVDIYWSVQPAHWRSVHVHWLDASTLVGVGGLWVAVFIWQLARGPWLQETVLETAGG
jgi:hypothetical protein